eukprot:361921-Chlamydomonas_euryale.AAC.5
MRHVVQTVHGQIGAATLANLCVSERCCCRIHLLVTEVPPLWHGHGCGMYVAQAGPDPVPLTRPPLQACGRSGLVPHAVPVSRGGLQARAVGATAVVVLPAPVTTITQVTRITRIPPGCARVQCEASRTPGRPSRPLAKGRGRGCRADCHSRARGQCGAAGVATISAAGHDMGPKQRVGRTDAHRISNLLRDTGPSLGKPLPGPPTPTPKPHARGSRRGAR